MKEDQVKITIPACEITLRANVFATTTGRALLERCPLVAQLGRWGDELYFDVPSVDVELEQDAAQIVPAGTLCFWVEGRVLALPFGPTPISLGDECRLVAPVNQWGRVTPDDMPHLPALGKVRAGMRILVERMT